MAKYRGKHEGTTRGKYVMAAFVSRQKSRNDNSKLYKNLDSYLNKRGFHIHINECYDVNRRSYTRGDCYHIGGASVSIERHDQETNQHKALIAHSIRIKLASNDSIDDIVEIIHQNFPSFEIADPRDIL